MSRKSSRLPSRNTWLFVVAVLLFASGLLSVATGILMDIGDFGPDDRGEWGAAENGLGLVNFGDDLEEVHTWSGYALAGLVLIHLVLNWRWTVGYLRGLRRT